MCGRHPRAIRKIVCLKINMLFRHALKPFAILIMLTCLPYKMLNLNEIKSLNGSVLLPGDKSISHRALIHASLAMGDSVISNLPSSRDVNATVKALIRLGVPIRQTAPGELSIMGGGGDLAPPANPIDCVNSGTTMRLLMGVLASCQFESELVGDESLSRRPMERVAEPLRMMGIEVITADGHAPVKIIGRADLKPLEYNLPVASSQVKSSLIYAAVYADGESLITEPMLSRDHTEIALEQICSTGYHRKLEGNSCRHIINGPSELDAFETSIPSDPSSAAYIVAIALLKQDSEVTFHNLLLNPRRIKYLEILKRMGGDIEIMPTGKEMGEIVGDVVVRSSELKNVEINKRDIPLIIDELPLLSVIATKAKGGFEIRGAGELRFKESDRLKAIVENLRRMGIEITEYPDGFTFDGQAKPVSAPINHFSDHRILMSLIVLSVIHNLELNFDDLSALGISFGEFMDYLSLLSG